jgi:23S rRNA (guanosine2251-2'-O)-methyltransferase
MIEQKKQIILGIQAVLETLRSGNPIDKILIEKETGKSTNFQELIDLARQLRVPIVRVPWARLQTISQKKHQGVIALSAVVGFVSLAEIVTQCFESGDNPLILILDRVKDVRNFGAIVRTAVCSGVHAIVIPHREAAPVNQDAMLTSAGALNYIHLSKEMNLQHTLKFLQNSGLQIVACTEKSERSIYEVDFTVPTAIVLGSEENGISEILLEQADQRAKIPIFGPVASLNVSVANGIILFEALRQRSF